MNELDPEQTRAAEHLLKLRDTIVAGNAGCGKTFMLNTVIAKVDASLGSEEWCKILCASHTACAGFGSRAQTISSYAAARGLDIPSDPNDPAACRKASQHFVRCLAKRQLSTRCRVLIIDEFTLLGATLTHLLHWRAKYFPRVAVWLSGDVGQIVKSPPPWKLTAFTAFLRVATVVCLVHNHRVKDSELRKFIKHCRDGTVETNMIHEYHHRICRKRIHPDAIVLTAAVRTCRRRVEMAAKLRHVDLMSIHDVLIGKKKKRMAEHTRVGINSQVMLTRRVKDESNATRNQGLFGTIIDIVEIAENDGFNADNVRVHIETSNNDTFWMRGQTSTTSGAKTSVTICHLDLIDAASMTVHRVQGATLGNQQQIAFDGQDAMEPGGPYVWATRVESFDQLAATNLSASRLDQLKPTKDQRDWANKLEALAVNLS
jgi:hypothetical protein